MGRVFLLAIALNVLLVLGEAIAGLIAGSMALIADAGHNLSDVLGLVLAGLAEWLRKGQAAGRWTYGKRSFTILAAQMNGVLLVAAIVGILSESLRRLWMPTEVLEGPVLIVAAVAVLLNLLTAWLLLGHQDDLNIHAAYLHMVADAGVSLAVVAGTALVMWTGWRWIDPALGIGICIVLSISTVRLLWKATTMMLHAAPSAENVAQIAQFLASLPEVHDVVDLHVWNVSTTDLLLSARLVCPSLDQKQQDAFLQRIHEALEAQFGIRHATVELLHTPPQQPHCSLDRASDSP